MSWVSLPHAVCAQSPAIRPDAVLGARRPRSWCIAAGTARHRRDGADQGCYGRHEPRHGQAGDGAAPFLRRSFVPSATEVNARQRVARRQPVRAALDRPSRGAERTRQKVQWAEMGRYGGRKSAKRGTRGKAPSRRTSRSGKPKVCAFCTSRVDWVDYKDVNTLRRLMSDKGKIKARRVTGTCRQHHVARQLVALAIKTARELALLPYAATPPVVDRPRRGGAGRGLRPPSGSDGQHRNSVRDDSSGPGSASRPRPNGGAQQADVNRHGTGAPDAECRSTPRTRRLDGVRRA